LTTSTQIATKKTLEDVINTFIKQYVDTSANGLDEADTKQFHSEVNICIHFRQRDEFDKPDDVSDFIVIFNPKSPTSDIRSYIDTTLRYAATNLGSWGRLLTFLYNGSRMTVEAKSVLTRFKDMEFPGFEISSYGSLDEKESALQCTRILQTMWQNWRTMAEYDTRVFAMMLSGLSFVNLPELWDQLRNAAKRTLLPAKMIQQLLQDAILRCDGKGAIGQRLCQRFSAKLEVTKLQQKSMGWETDSAKHMFVLNTVVNSLSMEDMVRETSTPTTESRGNRRNTLNIHNTSIYEDTSDSFLPDQEEIDLPHLLMNRNGAPTLEECLYAQTRMDQELSNEYIDQLQQENNSLNDTNILMQTFPIAGETPMKTDGHQSSSHPGRGFPNHGYNQRYNNDSNQGRGGYMGNNRRQNNTARFPFPSITEQPRFKWCACCGEKGGHMWENCPHKRNGPEQDTRAPPSVIKFQISLDKPKLLPLEEALKLCDQSSMRGNLKYHTALYVTQFKQQLTLNHENMKRAHKASPAGPVVIGVCRVAISKSVTDTSVGHNRHTPAIGRNQVLYTNSVLGYAKVTARKAFPSEILERLESCEPQLQAPEHQMDDRSIQSEEGPGDGDNIRLSETICLIDSGATPTAVTWKLVEDLNAPYERSYQRLEIEGVHGDLKRTSTVCWLTLTFNNKVSITVQAVVVDRLKSPILLGQTDFCNYNISLQTKANVLTFGDHLCPSHSEPLMTPEEITSFPEDGYVIIPDNKA
jgi:hypothetical protein